MFTAGELEVDGKSFAVEPKAVKAEPKPKVEAKKPEVKAVAAKPAKAVKTKKAA